MAMRIVAILFPLFAITALGFVAGRRLKPDLSHANKLNMDVFVPALVFAALANKEFHVTEYLPLLGATLLVVLGSGAVGWAVARMAGIDVRTFVPPQMFNNCGNLGLPLSVLAFGDSALAPAVAIFTVSNLLHFSYGAWLLDHKVRLINVWRVPSVLATLLGSGAVGWAVARMAGIDVRTFVPPQMFNNCGNLGLPLSVLAFGDSALAPAVAIFTVSNLLHFSYGAWLLDHKVRLINVWRVPSVLATLVGLAVGVAGIEVWPPLMHAIRMLGDIAIPLMLFALGVRLTDSRITSIGLGVFAAVLRPVSGMVLAWLVMLVIDLPPREQALLLVFGALPPAVLNYIFAERYRQEPEKVASMVLIGNVTALLFLPLALALSLE